ncbi:glucose-induced degradation protein 8-A homolog [Drosophila tropicalis]|uniref:glucose-induced degradation protein 8-A homolog n=1 Tax=Drosophila tropicalis TaxID=46794 RepID=UPI0035AC13A2
MANEEKKFNWCDRMKSFPCRQRDINRLVMNYLVREAYKETAQRYVIEAGIGKHPQLDSVEDRLLIRNAVRAGRVQYAMEVAKKLYPRLFETDNYMYFHMQQMQLIELIRERKADQSSVQKNPNFPMQGHQHHQRLESICEDRTLALLPKEKFDESRKRQQEELFPGLENCEPKMMFLIKLILWAQNQLEDVGFIDYERLELEGEHLDELLRRSMQED